MKIIWIFFLISISLIPAIHSLPPSKMSQKEVCGLRVIVLGSGHSNQSSNPRCDCVSFLHPCSWGRYKSISSPSQLWKTGFFQIVVATSLREGKLWIQTSCNLQKKLTLCHLLPVVVGLSKYIPPLRMSQKYYSISISFMQHSKVDFQAGHRVHTGLIKILFFLKNNSLYK